MTENTRPIYRDSNFNDNQLYQRKSSYSNNNNYSDKDEEPERDVEKKSPKYTLNSLKKYLASKRFFIKAQFVSENNIVFIKVHCETIGEDLIIYFPSAYNVPKEAGNIPIVDIIPYDITEQDILSVYQQEEKKTNENYSELRMDDLEDNDSFAEHFKPIAIDNNRDHAIRKMLVRYDKQLNKFCTCTAHLKYKFAILNNDILAVINRYNDTECYKIISNETLVSNMIDSKNDTVINIHHELFIMIDLPSFYEKMDQVPQDIIKIHKKFYATLNRAHVKQTALTEYRFKTYQPIIEKMMTEYSKNNKFIDMMGSLTTALDKSLQQEKQILEKIKIVQGQNSIGVDSEHSFKISKNEQDLQKIREVKTKTIKLLHEIKTKYHNFLLTFDSSITETCSYLKQIEDSLKLLNIY
jgi:hypothetical protein